MARSKENYKENIIDYIVSNNPKITKQGLEDMDIESLVLIKLQIEFEQARNKRQKKS
ncbi:MAG: hypothetical protein V4580_03370 [Bacteroidota bacterium]